MTSASTPLACRNQSAAVHLDQSTSDIETNAKSRVLAIGVPSHSREHLEDSIQCLTCDSHPGVGYVDP
jgi:hypothetical protein